MLSLFFTYSCNDRPRGTELVLALGNGALNETCTEPDPNRPSGVFRARDIRYHSGESGVPILRRRTRGDVSVSPGWLSLFSMSPAGSRPRCDLLKLVVDVLSPILRAHVLDELKAVALGFDGDELPVRAQAR